MYTIKTNDTYPVELSVNMDLSGVAESDIRLLARKTYNDVVEQLDVTILDPVGGVLEHKLTGTLTPGAYKLEVEVKTAEEVITFPNDGYLDLKVIRDLG